MKSICVCVFMVTVVANASNCYSNQHCSSCDQTSGSCLSECEKGFYGKQCNIMCSSGCLDDMCTDGGNGVEKCTLGCKLGYYGSRCEVPCRKPSYDEKCQKCPEDCEDGFCELETSCVTGCNNGYFGYNCTCDKISDCYSECKENCTETNTVKGKGSHLSVILSSGAGVCVFVFLSILAYRLKKRLMKRNRQPDRPEFGEAFSLDETDGYIEPRTCTKGSYIHAIDDHYVESN